MTPGRIIRAYLTNLVLGRLAEIGSGLWLALST